MDYNTYHIYNLKEEIFENEHIDNTINSYTVYNY